MGLRLSDISNPSLTALIVINVSVYILLAGSSLTQSGGAVADNLCLQPAWGTVAHRPWTIVTYAFTQANVLQLLFNMLWLYSFGRLFAMVAAPGRLIATYLAGAVVGGITFLTFSAWLGANASGWLMGSSAAVIAVAVAVAFMMPDCELNLPLVGMTRIKWIVAVVVLLFFIGLSAPNAGGNLAHLGGAAAGAVSGLLTRRATAGSATSPAEYDVIVDKIKRSGYDALTSKEKLRFFELSNKRNSR